MRHIRRIVDATDAMVTGSARKAIRIYYLHIEYRHVWPSESHTMPSDDEARP